LPVAFDWRGIVLDALLLERFIEFGDELSFTALVARHGPMVSNGCQRILGDEHQAGDAF
jgi:DNA-directed RNA polymerase specialized sigma24 family protein